MDFDHRQVQHSMARLKNQTSWVRWSKRVLDLALTVPALLLMAPLFLLVVLAVWLKMGAPVFFGQWRPGFHGIPFRLLKFRTMTDGRDAQGNLLPDAERLTLFGSFLRKSTLDELPELINVLRGEMSLVGPRPLLMEYYELYTCDQRRRHEMPPGMAGPVLAGGRNALTWEEKFALDVWYVDNWSLWLDFKVLLLTAWKVLKREGVSAEGYATMPKFTGKRNVAGKAGGGA